MGLLRSFRGVVENIFLNRYLANHGDEPWRELLLRCQEEIAATNPNPHYLSLYRETELFYWPYIPKWILEDGMSRKVGHCLDIGCAYGTLALFCRKLFECHCWCTDFLEGFLSEELASRHDFRFKVNNIELDPFPWDIKFDVIVFTEVLEHLNFHPVPTMRKIGDLLSPGGILYLSTPNAEVWGRVVKYYSDYRRMPSPRNGFPLLDTHVYQYDFREVREIAAEAGLRICKSNEGSGNAKKQINLALTKPALSGSP